MAEKKESVIKVLGRKIRRIFGGEIGELESAKRLEELRKKYEAKKTRDTSHGKIFII